MDKHYILTLMETPKLGRKTVKKVLDTMEFMPTSLEDLYDLLKETKRLHSRVTLPTKEQLKKAYLNAETIIYKAEELGIKVIEPSDPDFPVELNFIKDPPVILYGKGDTDCLNAKYSVAVVGTRQPTKFGRDMAECFGMLLGEKGVVVVSGLALGCDAGAHQGCINVSGKTIAVLANGLDTIYPKKNTKLAEDIIENSGCILSEYPPGVNIMNSYLVDRDRLQSGLCQAVIIVETDLKGGTMHTAKFSLEQNKILACLDHSEKFDNNKSQGNRKLISEGKALPIKNESDIDSLIKTIMDMPKVERHNQNSDSSVLKEKQQSLFRQGD